MPFRETFSYFWMGFVSWVKRHTTREALIDGLKTGPWVVGLTILIWVYAEQQQRTEEKGQPVLISVRSAEPDRIVTLIRPHDDVPIITMNGPRQAVEEVKRRLNEAGDHRLITVDVPSSLEPGVRDINIELPIKNASIFTKSGISITDVSPRTIQVRIDPLETHDVEVAAPANANLEGPATFEPKVVKVRAPRESFQEAGNKLKAIAQIPTTGDLAKPGTHDVKLPIEVPLSGENVTVATTTVMAHYEIKQSAIDATIPSVLIETAFVGNVASEVLVDLPSPPVVKDVKINGPAEKCKQVIDNANSNRDPKPYATIQIDAEDVREVVTGAVPSKTLTKRIKFETGDPDVMATDTSRTIDVTVRKRPTPGGG